MGGPERRMIKMQYAYESNPKRKVINYASQICKIISISKRQKKGIGILASLFLFAFFPQKKLGQAMVVHGLGPSTERLMRV